MSSEILWGSQIPENVLEPKYWNGHNPKDDCEEISGTVRNHKQFRAHNRRYNQLMEAVWEASFSFAQDFWQKKTSIALSEFRTGTTFDARQHSIGTILKEYSETLIGSSDDGLPGYYKLALIGIVCEAELEGVRQRLIARWYEISSGDPNMLSFGGPVIEIGAVDHSKGRSWPSMTLNNIKKVTKVEILLAGLGQTQESREAIRGLPEFSFSPQST